MKRTTTSKPRAAVDELESLFKALADKTRLRILALLGNNEVCVCHIHDSLGLPNRPSPAIWRICGRAVSWQPAATVYGCTTRCRDR